MYRFFNGISEEGKAGLDSRRMRSPLVKTFLLEHSLWNRDVSQRGDDRFGKLVFRHESVFDMPTDEVLATENEDAEETADENLDEDRPELERRTVRSEIKDRIGPIRRVLWQPINLEMTKSRLVAILPKGTCGNTFHRLVANVQRYVCPKVEVWLGATPFHELVTPR